MKTRFTAMTGLMCAALVASAALPVAAARAAKVIKDADITSAIESDMLINDALNSHDINVSTANGIVSLSGSVYNILARDTATELAESTRGVRSVVNEIVVKPVYRTDAEVEADVVDALLADPATDSWTIDVKVNDGVVTLGGTADSYAEKNLCTDVAKGVRGVKDVKNDIGVTYGEKRPDAEIQREITALLNADVRIDAWDINVKVKNGVVTLDGTVGSAVEKSRVRSKAWVAGVTSVDADALNVEWWAKDDMQRESTYVYTTDKDIVKAVKDALVQDPRVWSFEVTPFATYGDVTLTGTVDNMKAKMSAEDDAKNTIGVWRVKNHLKVRPPAYLSDDDIAANVKAALGRDPYVNRYDVTVSVYNGKAYLYGSVDTEFEKTKATDVAWRVNGVLDVANYIAVRDVWPRKSDWSIREDVKDRLYWDASVDATDVTVSAKDGTVTLTGTVDTWHEYNRVAEDAYLGGASDVRNLLHVNNAPPTYDY